MKLVIEHFVTFLLLLVFLWVGISYVMQNVRHTGARDFHSAVIRKIEDSNYDSGVIEECRSRAQKNGYQLVVSCYGDVTANAAKVALSYCCKLPIVQTEKEYCIEGYCR